MTAFKDIDLIGSIEIAGDGDLGAVAVYISQFHRKAIGLAQPLAAVGEDTGTIVQQDFVGLIEPTGNKSIQVAVAIQITQGNVGTGGVTQTRVGIARDRWYR